MILQALTEHYETLVSQGKVAEPGWANEGVSFALYINDAGELEQVASLKTEQMRGKKPVYTPQEILLPASRKKSSDITPDFLWDKSSYLLGIGKNAPRALKSFQASRAFHHQLLNGIEGPTAKALLAFFDHWEPSKAEVHPVLQNDWKELASGAVLVFRYNGAYIHNDPSLRQIWQTFYTNETQNGSQQTCLVTGKTAPIAKTHPSILGAGGTNPKLVSFDKDSPAFCSYGKEQGFNAPVSEYAAFAYAAALNCLIKNRSPNQQIGDTTVLFWAKSGQAAFQDFFSAFVFGGPSFYDEGDLARTLEKLLKGESCLFNASQLDPHMDFYILGVSPNKGRLSVRFFLRNTFGGFLENVQQHNERLEIVRPSFDKFEAIPLWKLLGATVNQKSNDKSPSPGMAGETLRAILTNTPYPATLLNGVTLRIRAECSPSAEDRKKPPYNEKASPVTYIRAAILKAYYTKLAEAHRRENPDIPKEVLTVSLNPNSTNIPYNLGRLFSVLEAIQSAANPGINTTIKDKYFNSASSTPSHVFPTLINLAQKHLQKLEKGQQIYYNKQLTELTDKFGEAYPDRLGLPQQGSFQLGYYHQTQARYQKKEEE